jgi:hypothetical protein
MMRTTRVCTFARERYRFLRPRNLCASTVTQPRKPMTRVNLVGLRDSKPQPQPCEGEVSTHSDQPSDEEDP